jgi:CheY-like chemotaxis protein
MHLLVLDDDDRLTDFIASVARRQGWTVDTAGWVTTFHALFSAHKPDAIMLDLQLGVSDGIEQLHFLHGNGFSGPVVLMSGFDARVLASAQQVGTSLGMTIATVIEKPARITRVIEVLQELKTIMLHSTITDTPGDTKTAPSGNVLISCDSIASAIRADEMELYLQPIVSTADGTVRRAEGLIRWHRPSSGLISPDRFIPVAEQSDELIDQLTQWVIKAALQKYRLLSERGLDIQVCINLSGRNLHSLEFPDQLTVVVARSVGADRCDWAGSDRKRSHARHQGHYGHPDATSAEGVFNRDRRFRNRIFVTRCTAPNAILGDQD